MIAPGEPPLALAGLACISAFSLQCRQPRFATDVCENAILVVPEQLRMPKVAAYEQIRVTFVVIVSSAGTRGGRVGGRPRFPGRVSQGTVTVVVT